MVSDSGVILIAVRKLKWKDIKTIFRFGGLRILLSKKFPQLFWWRNKEYIIYMNLAGYIWTVWYGQTITNDSTTTSPSFSAHFLLPVLLKDAEKEFPRRTGWHVSFDSIFLLLFYNISPFSSFLLILWESWANALWVMVLEMLIQFPFNFQLYTENGLSTNFMD